MIQYLSMIGIGLCNVGRNLMYKRSLFERVGGYAAHQNIQSGDDDLFMRDAATSLNTV